MTGSYPVHNLARLRRKALRNRRNPLPDTYAANDPGLEYYRTSVESRTVEHKHRRLTASCGDQIPSAGCRLLQQACPHSVEKLWFSTAPDQI